MRNRKIDAQLAPAMMSLAATNQQLLGLVGSRRNVLWRIVPIGIAAAGFRYATAEPDERQAMLEQAQALLSQGQAVLESTGVLEKVFK
jgi:multidrug efflux pump subunit AcrA (membrane-fusion protein)